MGENTLLDCASPGDSPVFNYIFLKMQVKDAQVELAKRELARRDFLHYIKYIFPKFQDIAYQGNSEDKVHHRITDALMRVARGECKRLMIFCPPRF
nr:MAG TPA: hypothetical protein [Caudoviricetes sp.]